MQRTFFSLATNMEQKTASKALFNYVLDQVRKQEIVLNARIANQGIDIDGDSEDSRMDGGYSLNLYGISCDSYEDKEFGGSEDVCNEFIEEAIIVDHRLNQSYQLDSFQTMSLIQYLRFTKGYDYTNLEIL